MDVKELIGVGPVLAERLEAAGFGTVEAVAAGSTADLTAVSGVGPSLAGRLRDQATACVAPAVTTESPVAERVKRLRRAIPDLAKSKKHADVLKQSTKRMTSWIDDLDRRKIRKRFVAETGRIVDEAKKRTSSKKAAKRLRKHATKIEAAVRNS